MIMTHQTKTLKKIAKKMIMIQEEQQHTIFGGRCHVLSMLESDHSKGRIL
jgi:hypothetical protein